MLEDLPVQLTATGGSGGLQGEKLDNMPMQFATTGDSVELQCEMLDDMLLQAVTTGAVAGCSMRQCNLCQCILLPIVAEVSWSAREAGRFASAACRP